MNYLGNDQISNGFFKSSCQSQLWFPLSADSSHSHCLWLLLSAECSLTMHFLVLNTVYLFCHSRALHMTTLQGAGGGSGGGGGSAAPCTSMQRRGCFQHLTLFFLIEPFHNNPNKMTDTDNTPFLWSKENDKSHRYVMKHCLARVQARPRPSRLRATSSHGCCTKSQKQWNPGPCTQDSSRPLQHQAVLGKGLLRTRILLPLRSCLWDQTKRPEQKRLKGTTEAFLKYRTIWQFRQAQNKYIQENKQQESAKDYYYISRMKSHVSI